MNYIAATKIAANSSDSFMNILSMFLLILCLIFQTAIAAVDWYYLGVVVGSCFSGAILLSYMRREKSRSEMYFKALASMIAGIVFGGAAVKWFKVVELEFVVFCYFVSSLLSLMLIRSAFAETEQNAPRIVISFFQRIFNYKPRQQRRVIRRRESLPVESQENPLDQTQEK